MTVAAPGASRAAKRGGWKSQSLPGVALREAEVMFPLACGLPHFVACKTNFTDVFVLAVFGTHAAKPVTRHGLDAARTQG